MSRYDQAKGFGDMSWLDGPERNADEFMNSRAYDEGLRRAYTEPELRLCVGERHWIDCSHIRRDIAEAVQPWREFVEEFVQWADDGERDDDGLIAKARKLLGP